MKLRKLLYFHTDKLSQTLESEKMAAASNKEAKKKRKAKAKKNPDYILLNYFFERDNSTSETYYPDNPIDNCRQQFYQASDVLIFSVRDHFDQPSFLVYEQLEVSLLKALNSEDSSSKSEFVREKYGDDINVNDLIAELNIFKVLFKDKNIVQRN